MREMFECKECGHEWRRVKKLYRRYWYTSTKPVECPKCKTGLWWLTKDERFELMRQAIKKMEGRYESNR